MDEQTFYFIRQDKPAALKFTINGEVWVYLSLVERQETASLFNILTLKYYSAFVCTCTYRPSTVYVHVYIHFI